MRQDVTLNSFGHPRPPVDDNRKLTAAEWARYLGFVDKHDNPDVERFKRAVELDHE